MMSWKLPLQRWIPRRPALMMRSLPKTPKRGINCGTPILRLRGVRSCKRSSGLWCFISFAVSRRIRISAFPRWDFRALVITDTSSGTRIHGCFLCLQSCIRSLQNRWWCFDIEPLMPPGIKQRNWDFAERCTHGKAMKSGMKQRPSLHTRMRFMKSMSPRTSQSLNGSITSRQAIKNGWKITDIPSFNRPRTSGLAGWLSMPRRIVTKLG